MLTQDRFLGADLDPQAKSAFMAQGVDDIDFVAALIRRHLDGDFAPASALDFGCGVGRLVIAMSRLAARVTGIDGSRNMLARAAENARQAGLDQVRFGETIPEESFDWINSFIVFQHIEPQKGIAILKTLLSRLAPGGVVSLHFTIYRDSRIWHRGIQELEFGRYDGKSYLNFNRGPLRDMPIYEYDLSEIVCHLNAAGIETLAMRHLDHQGLHGVWIVGRRDG
ncbi:MAG TPA: class I SAM-dependent methyltransferase [Rhizomicrobium sp.]